MFRLILLSAFLWGKMSNTVTSPFMNLEIPLVGVQVGPTWASDLNAALLLVDAHNHTSGNGIQIPTAGINIDANVDFNNYKAIVMKSVNFQDQASSVDLRSIYTINGDLYYNNEDGDPVQITDGAGLNFASLGTIGGDYGQPGINASVVYTDLLKLYSFYQSSGVTADALVGDVILTEKVVSANTVTLKSPTSLATSYSVTFPTVLPTNESNLRITPAGVVKTNADVHTWRTGANGVYNILTVPTDYLDGRFSLPFQSRIVDVVMRVHKSGSSGSTTADVLYDNAGTPVTIFTTKPSIATTAGDDAKVRVGSVGTGLTAPVLNGSPYLLAANTDIMWNLTAAQVGTAVEGMSLEIVFERV